MRDICRFYAGRLFATLNAGFTPIIGTAGALTTLESWAATSAHEIIFLKLPMHYCCHFDRHLSCNVVVNGGSLRARVFKGSRPAQHHVEVLRPALYA